MRKVLIIGNPNVGKSTLFNSLTNSSEHTGNFHGVTVEEKAKIINFNNEKYEIVDLPGLYSLNSYSFEEEISKHHILANKDINLVLIDANSLRKNLYLCQQLNELKIQYKILINNYDYFCKNNNKLNIKKLQENLGVEIEIINAKNTKLNNNKLLFKNNKKNIKKYNYLNNIIEKVQNKLNIEEEKIIYALNGINKDIKEEDFKYIQTFNEDIVRERFFYIDNVLKNSIEINKNFIYGTSKLDKFFLNPILMTITFLLTFFLSLYLIFFTIGSWLSDSLSWLCETVIVNPIMNFLISVTDNVWIIEFFSGGVFSSLFIILSFLPQIILMFIFITLLEDSGIISRMAYVFDDFLSHFGLNGKAVYIMLLGLGCNTMSTMATRNMSEKNLKTKSAILNPYISCMARLPIFVIIASTFFSKQAYFIIAGLYILGFVIALILGMILNKTILKSRQSGLLLEFAPMRAPDLKHVFQVAKVNAKDMFKRLFGVIVSVSIIVWILTHTNFSFHYTQNINESIMFFVSQKISFLFAPIGLDNAGIVCALLVGIMAKELIVSTMTICNNATNTNELMQTMLISTSAICFTKASAVSFLIFSLLYCPCASNIAVLKQETDKFTTILAVITQFTIAYMLSFVVFQSITHGVWFMSISIVVISLIMLAVIFITKKTKRGKCLTCGKCK